MTDHISPASGNRPASIERDFEPDEQRTFRVTISGTVEIEAVSIEAAQDDVREMIEDHLDALTFDAELRKGQS